MYAYNVLTTQYIVIILKELFINGRRENRENPLTFYGENLKIHSYRFDA